MTGDKSTLLTQELLVTAADGGALIDKDRQQARLLVKIALVGKDGGPQEEGKELLFYACEYGHAELISFLIHQGTDITGGD
jgi:hypothetical protein